MSVFKSVSTDSSTILEACKVCNRYSKYDGIVSIIPQASWFSPSVPIEDLRVSIVNSTEAAQALAITHSPTVGMIAAASSSIGGGIEYYLQAYTAHHSAAHRSAAYKPL